MANIADEAFERIQCYGIGAWFIDLFAYLKQPPPYGLAPGDRYETPKSSGLTVKLARLAGIVPARPGPLQDIVLSQVAGDATAPMPLGLDASTETPDSARQKLSFTVDGGSPNDLAKGDTRISYFMSDGRLVELRFNSSLVGFDRYVLARLGVATDRSGQP